MVCYVVPLIVAIATTLFWSSKGKGPAGWWLNLFLYGSAIFGFVDHLWFGELFLISNAWRMDLLLGVTITAAIFGGWGLTMGMAKLNPALAQRMGLVNQESQFSQ